MDLNFLTEYAIPTIIGICLCLGYIVKTSIPKVSNKHIPLILSIVGIFLNVWINNAISPTILLGGMFSGLSSIGLHQLFINTFIKKEGE